MASAVRVVSEYKSKVCGQPSQACRARIPMGSICNTSSSDIPRGSSIWSKTHRIVKTVGPESTPTPSTCTWRIFPPGWLALSIKVTSSPRCANTNALTKPPMPAPTTTTRGVRIDLCIVFAHPMALHLQRYKTRKHGFRKIAVFLSCLNRR